MRKTLLLSLAAVSLLASQSVDDLIELAIKNSPDIKISKLNVESSKAQVDVATSYYLPQIDLNANAGKGGLKLKGQNALNDIDVLGATANASQLIFDFGKTIGNIDSSRYNFKSYDAQNTQIISDKILDVRLKYYELLKAKSLIGVNQENVKLNEFQLYRAKRYFEAGIRTKIDISDAEVNLIKAEISLKNALYDKDLAKVNLEKTIGVMDSDLDVQYSQLDYDNLYSSLANVTQNIDELVKDAFANRYEIKAYEENVKASKSKVTSAEGDYFPSIGLNGNYVANRVDNAVALTTPQNQWSATVGLNWNLFSGFHTLASSQVAKIGVMKSNEELGNLKLSIQRDVNEAYINVQKKKENVRLNGSLKESSYEKFDQAQKRYENGLSDYIELQQARQGYIDSLSGLVIAYFDYYQAYSQLQHAIGK